jgi:signal transduction histidine kinase
MTMAALRSRLWPAAPTGVTAAAAQWHYARPIGLSLAAYLLYIATFIAFESALGSRVGMFVTLPVVGAAWFFGIRIGLAAVVVGSATNSLLLAVITDMGIGDQVSDSGWLLGSATLIFVTTVVGRLQSLEREHGEASRRLQRLSRRLAESKEEQSRHIARELHDEIGQHLTGLKMQLEIGTDTSLARASELTLELMRQVRSLSVDLRPAVLDDLGLVPALRTLTGRFTELTSVRVALDVTRVAQRLNPRVEIAAYRIVQEALTNVAKHARVDEASVRATINRSRLRLAIEDQSVGIEQRGHHGGRQFEASGLSGMRDRARAIGGSVEIAGRAGGGTAVVADLPLEPEPILDEPDPRTPAA